MSIELTPAHAHGFLRKPHWALPTCAVRCDLPCREDQDNLLPSHEYLDSPDVLREKMEVLADLLRRSSYTTLYTGAGLSRSAGIADYATKAQESVTADIPIKKKSMMFSAQPTFAHFALTALYRAGLIRCFMQQNHDGLPQKSGFPQEAMNEIHGSWFDVSNPVVRFDESERRDLFDDLLRQESATDLTICIGSSLSGMSADRICDTPANKAYHKRALGLVLINLQRTRLDFVSSLRVWAKADDALRTLVDIMGLAPIPQRVFRLSQMGDVFEVPYNAEGRLDATVRMIWDLSVGTQIVVAVSQAKNYKRCGAVLKRDKEENWKIHFPKIGLKNAVTRRLGAWWVDAAIRGAIPQLPIVNPAPSVRSLSAPGKLPKSLPQRKPISQTSK